MNKKILPAFLLFLLFLSCATDSYLYNGFQENNRNGKHRYQNITNVTLRGYNSSISVSGIDEKYVVLNSGYDELDIISGKMVITLRNRREFNIGVPYGIPLYVRNSDGEVAFLNTRGAIWAQLRNCRVIILNAGTDVDVQTTNGKIYVIKRFGRIEKYNLKTTNAPVEIGLADADVWVDMETTSGRFEISNFSYYITYRDRGKLSGYIGSNPEGHISLETTNGSISIKHAGLLSMGYLRNLPAAFSLSLRVYLMNKLVSLERYLRWMFTDVDFIKERLRGEENKTVYEVDESEESEIEIEPRYTVVFPFRETTENIRGSGLGEAVAEMFVIALGNGNSFIVVERSQIDAVLKETSFQLSGLTGEEESLKIGNILNGELLVLGTVARFKERIELDVRLIKVETGEIIFTTYGSTGEENLREMINELSKEIENAAIAYFKQA